jgi:hypothetical protein
MRLDYRSLPAARVILLRQIEIRVLLVEVCAWTDDLHRGLS